MLLSGAAFGGAVLSPAGLFAPPGLLDAFPGAAFAYSTRRLSRSWTGALLRVRRNTDNGQGDVMPDNLGNISLTSVVNNRSDGGATTTLATFIGANHSFISTWYDQTGNGRHGTQATTGLQPQIVVSGALCTSGNNARATAQFRGAHYIDSGYNGGNTTYSTFMTAANQRSTLPASNQVDAVLSLGDGGGANTLFEVETFNSLRIRRSAHGQAAAIKMAHHRL